MELDWIWKAVLIVISGTFLLRIAGRKSISQMTLPQTVIMIAIGSLLVQPVSGKNIWVTIAVGGILILTLIVMEYGQLKVDGIEKLITGNSKILIENGTINQENMKKLRLTVDQLEMKLRQLNVTSLNDVHYATLEPNGQLGYTLKPEAQPVTKKELQKISSDIQTLQLSIDKLTTSPVQQTSIQQLVKTNSQEDIFKEVDTKEHKTIPPKNLQ
ncbi:DUF421 domain-containing protein [Virgibacillus ndiopensis]|uniref:DUF421 domain-containing protein n=1 Tax=Virgibacillus ndiopensis TaxID=2004408 RepID=UPI000C08D3C2|nr:DUF421 domain-containing protein [Virgibacillus ndiopensis]